MKKLLVVTGLVLSSMMSYGQDRVNKKPISWDEVSTPFTSAVGWQYSESEGKWKSQINCICDKVEIKYDQHFYDLQVKSLTFNKNKYYVLIQKKKGVDWEYPTIGRGFRTYTQHVVFLFKDDDFNKLNNIEDNTSINLIKLTDTGWYDVMYDKVNVEKFIKDAVREYLEKSDNGETLYEPFYRFNITKAKNLNKDVYRFLLPENASDSYLDSEFDIKKTYFEVTSLNKLSTLNKIK
jgi:hypothetical protein